jgi:hypothetical protein
MKLELKHLAPYLPYKLNYMVWNGDAKPYVKEMEEMRTYTSSVFAHIKSKPILIPLSYFNNWIIKDKKDFLGVNHNQMMEFLGFSDGQIKLENISLGLYLAMCNKHIDFNFLIEKGLAININKI